MEIRGKIKKIFETQTFNSGFQKRELVVTTQEQYPQDIAIEFLQDKIALLDPLNIGEDIKVSINIRGREWINPEGEAKYFNSINGWRVEKIAADAGSFSQDIPPTPPPANNFPAETVKSNEEDDLPF